MYQKKLADWALPENERPLDVNSADDAKLAKLLSAFSNPTEALNEAAIIATTDARGTILAVNQKFCDLSEYSREELIGQNHRLLKSGIHDADFFRHLYRTISSGETWHNTVCNKAKSGRLYWVDTTIVPNWDGDGKIIGYTSVRFDVTPLKAARRDLENHAQFDRLTCALNRTHFLHQLNARHQQPFTLAMMDLDNFKEVNEAGGPSAGDQLLIDAANIIANYLEENEFFGRLGGNEFAIILKRNGDADRFESCLRAIAQDIYNLDQRGLNLPRRTASFGLARYPQDGTMASQLIQYADLAVAAAKKAGGNIWRSFEAEMVEEEWRFNQLRAEFFAALAAGEITLFYQPIQPLAPHHPISFEALIRWRREDGKLWSPADFAELFRDDAVLREMGVFVVRTAIDQIKSWSASGLIFHHLAINAAGPDLRSETFIQIIRDAISEKRIQPNQLCVEITEDMLLDQQADQVRQAIDQLHKLGIAIAFDDFGTGFASLTHLRELPINFVKIDRSFIQSLHQNSKDRVIVESIIGLAHRLELGVVAEGVELQIQRQMLGGMGCDYVQGYWISEPLDSAQATEFIRRVSA